MDKFYSVILEQSGQKYFFKSYENAAAFLLESYFDDVMVENEKEIMAINNEVADNHSIENYGWINEEIFED